MIFPLVCSSVSPLLLHLLLLLLIPLPLPPLPPPPPPPPPQPPPSLPPSLLSTTSSSPISSSASTLHHPPPLSDCLSLAADRQNFASFHFTVQPSTLVGPVRPFYTREKTINPPLHFLMGGVGGYFPITKRYLLPHFFRP